MDETKLTSDTATPGHTDFRIRAIPPTVLDQVRSDGVDDLGNGLQITVDREGGAPLRCCLRDSRPGERLGSMAYCPFPREGPYAETGPVFIHAERCDGYDDATAYPEGFRHRQQIFRAYGFDRTIVDATIVEGSAAEKAIAELLARPDVDFVHSRNVAYGCFMFQIERPHP